MKSAVPYKGGTMKLERAESPVGTNPEKKLQTETHDLSTAVLDRVKALIADYNTKLCQSPPLFGIEASRGPQNEINIQLEVTSKFTLALLSKATGTVHKDLARDLIVQALMVLPPRVGEEQHALDRRAANIPSSTCHATFEEGFHRERPGNGILQRKPGR
jgi:hypothetical protein